MEAINEPTVKTEIEKDVSRSLVISKALETALNSMYEKAGGKEVNSTLSLTMLVMAALHGNDIYDAVITDYTNKLKA